MIRTLIVLCAIAAIALGGSAPKLSVRYDINPMNIGKTSFMDLPQTLDEATKEGWIAVDGPESPAGLESLTLMCPSDVYSLCFLFDDLGNVAGYQVALDKTKFKGPYDMKVQGFTEWSTTCNGQSVTYYTNRVYFVSADYLATDSETRRANYDSSTLFQEGKIWLTSFNGELLEVSTDTTSWDGGDFTKQACFPWMGNHYYYKMTKSLECSAESLLSWFLLKYNNEVVGLGFGVMGTLTTGTGKIYNEAPSVAAVKLIVPTAPECYYKNAEDYGVTTMHLYFVERPYAMSCLLEGFGL